jgi:hypothetical protein
MPKMCLVKMVSGPKNRDFGLSPAMIVFTFVVTKSIGDQCWRQLSLANQNFIAAADKGCTGNGINFPVVGGKIWKKFKIKIRVVRDSCPKG